MPRPLNRGVGGLLNIFPHYYGKSVPAREEYEIQIRQRCWYSLHVDTLSKGQSAGSAQRIVNGVTTTCIICDLTEPLHEQDNKS